MGFHIAHPQVIQGTHFGSISHLPAPPQIAGGYNPNNYQPAAIPMPERNTHQAPNPRAGGQVPPKLAELLRQKQERPSPQDERPRSVLDSSLEALGQGFGQSVSQGIPNAVQQHMRRSLLDKTLGMINPNMSPLE